MVADHVDSSPEREKKKYFIVVSSTSNKQQQQTSPNNNKAPTYITQLTSPSSLPSSYKKPTPISSFTYIYPYLIYPSTFTVYTLLILPQKPLRSSFNTIQYITAHPQYAKTAVARHRADLEREALGTEGTPKKKKIASVYVQPDWVPPQSRLERANIIPFAISISILIDRVNRVLVCPPFPGSFRAILTRYRPRTPAKTPLRHQLRALRLPKVTREKNKRQSSEEE